MRQIYTSIGVIVTLATAIVFFTGCFDIERDVSGLIEGRVKVLNEDERVPRFAKGANYLAAIKYTSRLKGSPIKDLSAVLRKTTFVILVQRTDDRFSFIDEFEFNLANGTLIKNKDGTYNIEVNDSKDRQLALSGKIEFKIEVDSDHFKSAAHKIKGDLVIKKAQEAERDDLALASLTFRQLFSAAE